MDCNYRIRTAAGCHERPVAVARRRHAVGHLCLLEAAQPYLTIWASIFAHAATKRAARVTSTGQSQAQPLTPRQRRLAQQRRKWEEAQRQQHKHQQEGPHTQGSSSPPPKRTAPSSGKACEAARPRSAPRPSDVHPGPGGATSSLKGVSGRSPAFDGLADTAARRQLASPPSQQQRLRLQEQQEQQQQQGQQEGRWPSLFAGEVVGGGVLLDSLPAPQLVALARQWADELATLGDCQGDPLPVHAGLLSSLMTSSDCDVADVVTPAQHTGTASSVSPIAADASNTSSCGPCSELPSAHLPPVVASRLAQLSSAVHSQLSRGELSHQELADLSWCIGHYDRVHSLRVLQPLLEVPFVVIPRFMPSLRLEDFMAEVELGRDTIYLDDGSRVVEESRLTGWQSDIGATFRYSGKEMQPQFGGLSAQVLTVRDALWALTGVKYDSVLINYYADGKCGMRYHVDPLYDRWTPNSAVVSLGDTRTFIFREIKDHNTRWQYQVRNGDVVLMFGDCQERLQHCVRVERRAEDAGPRMSLVFKERIRDPGGEYLLP